MLLRVVVKRDECHKVMGHPAIPRHTGRFLSKLSLKQVLSDKLGTFPKIMKNINIKVPLSTVYIGMTSNSSPIQTPQSTFQG